jgi:plasmid stability protein
MAMPDSGLRGAGFHPATTAFEPACLSVRIPSHGNGAVRLCYCEFVKNITVSIPDDVYRRARIAAAERDTSLSAMVRTFLTALGPEESESARLKRLQKEVLSTVRRFRAGDRLTRGQVHQRNALR